ncbi:MAG: TrkA family potassium uptake protein [Clostridia bacterium]|nr:TrkA family potassium uptake protein [Clostridia bacterium]
MDKSVAVLGLGEFGQSLAENLAILGADVMVVDRDRELVQEFSSKVTVCVCADLADEQQLNELGLSNMDTVVVAMGASLAASVMSVMVAKEQNVPYVMAKASSPSMAAILMKVGADKVFNPEEESGLRTAQLLVSSAFLNLFNVDDDFSIVEMLPKRKWIGKSLIQLDLRRKYNVNVIAVSREQGNWHFIDPTVPIEDGMRLLVASERKDLDRLSP